MNRSTQWANGVLTPTVSTSAAHLMGELGPEFVPPALSPVQHRSFFLERSNFAEDGTFEGLASAFGVEDSYGTEWAPGAWTAGGLKPGAQRALLWMHSPYEPIGVFTATEREDGLWIAGRYDETDEGARARKRAMSGSASELSVGFMVHGTDPENADIFTSTSLVEVSQITRNFAAQPGAALTGVRATKQGGKAEEVKAREALIRQRARGVLLLAGAQEIRGAIAPHSTATSDGKWDAAAALKNLPADATAATLRKMFAWVDPDKDPKTKAAYKLPHHEVSSDGKIGAANLAACSAAIAALNGGRGGADIPSGDRKAVWDHLARHLKDGGNDSPPPLK